MPPYINYECESLDERINKLIAIAKEKFGFDLSAYYNLMMTDYSTSLESFGEGIRWPQSPNIDFEIVLCLRIHGMAYLFSKDQFEVKVDYKNANAIIMKQMEDRQNKLERDMLREKLRLSGIDPIYD